MGQPFPRIVHPLPPRDIARILNEAGYDEPADPPSRLEQGLTVAIVWLSVIVVAFFANHLIGAAVWEFLS